MNNILRYQPWRSGLRRMILNNRPYPLPSHVHNKNKKPSNIPQKMSDKKSERNNDSKNPPTKKKKPIGVIYF